MSEETPPAHQSACPHPEAVGTRWGDPISEERQAELQALADRQQDWAAKPKAERGDSCFDGVRLTGADVYWLAEASGRGKDGDVPSLHLEGARLEGAHLEGASLAAAHLEGAQLYRAHLEGAMLHEAHLERAFLAAAHLERAFLGWAHLEGAMLYADQRDAHLEGAMLREAHLEGAILRTAHLEEADLGGAHLEGADFREAHLEGAMLRMAYLEQADLDGAHLEGAYLLSADLERATLRDAHLKRAILRGARLVGAGLRGAHLEEADLTASTLDKTSHLNGALLTATSLDQVTYDNVNLTVVDWSLVPVLGDELAARSAKGANGKPKDAVKRREEYTAAVRANRVLAVTLRAQGMNEDADKYAYRAQVLERQVLRRRGILGAAFGSWLLDRVAGYGYKPMRSVWTYIVVILLFAATYFSITNFGITPFLPTHSTPLAWYEALVLSISSFHGRGLFPTGLNLGDPVAILAAVEAVIGLLIEITFIATFTQRFFAR